MNNRTTIENNQFFKFQTLIYLIKSWLDKAFKGTVVNQTLHGGSLKNHAYSPFKLDF